MSIELKSRSRRGFSAIELMIVMTLLGTVAVFALPKIVATRRQLELETAGQQLAFRIERAQSEARTRNRSISLYRVGQTGYRLETEANVTQLPTGLRFASGASDSVRFNSFGFSATGAGTFDIQFGSRVRRVRVSAAGMVMR